MIEKQHTVIGEGGEIISNEVQVIRKLKVEEFCQVYLKDNVEFYTLSKAEYQVLAYCWYESKYYEDKNYPGNKLVCDKQFREAVKEKTKLAESTIKNAIASLSEKKMLLKDLEYRGVYYLNPKYFFKGTLSSRTELITKITEYQLT